MKTIVIKNDFSEDHITRIAGEKLRFQILGADAKKEKIIIDFSGVCIASTSFFDEGFAKLTEAGWTLKDLETKIILKNIDPNDRRLLSKMCQNRGMK